MTSLDRQRLIDQLIRHEGLELKPYRDTVGKLTIGIGRNLDDVGITEQEAMYLAGADVDRVLLGLVERYPTWFPDLGPVRQCVLVNMGFNLGLAKLATFKRTLASIARKQYGQAADEMIDSLWAKQVGQRAVELAAMMKTGSWQP